MPIRVLGVDPGLAKTGIAAIERRDDGALVSWGVRLVSTKPRAGGRRSDDDERRVREAWDVVRECIVTFKPQALAVEAYTVYGEKDIATLKEKARALVNYVSARPAPAFVESLGDPKELLRFARAVDALRRALDTGREEVGVRGRGKAAKTLAVVGAAMALGWEHGLRVHIHMPTDLRWHFLGRKKGSKDEIATLVRTHVHGLEEAVWARVAPSLQEHVWDAAAHAVLGIDDELKKKKACGE